MRCSGPSGCGKTTLLNIISGLVTPSRGRCCSTAATSRALPTEQRNIAQVFQFPVIYDTMTVAREPRLPAEEPRHAARQDRRRGSREIAELLDLTPLPRRARPRGSPPTPSRRSRSAAGWCAPDVAAILFDEPLTVIDPAPEVGAALEAEGAAPRARPHDDLRDARPDRGADLRRHGGRDARRQGGADRHAGGAVRAARRTPSSATSSARRA